MQHHCLKMMLTIIFVLLIFQSCSSEKKFKVPTSAMEPAILVHEEISVDMEAYREKAPRPGDVVVFNSPSNVTGMNVKRCVATGGQIVEIRDGVLYVDNVLFDSSLVLKRTNPAIRPKVFQDPKIFPPNAGNTDNYGPVKVPDGTFFMLGDHRDDSYDSRYFGFVGRQSVLGKAVMIARSEDQSRVGRKIL